MTDDTVREGWEDDREIDAVRKTSLQAYKRIKDEGLLSMSRFAVYEKLCYATRYDGNPITAGELKQIARDVFRLKHVDGYHKRLSELRDLGVVREGGERKCRATGYKAVTWMVTGSLPTGSMQSETFASTPPKADLRAAAEQFKFWRNTAILNGDPVSDAVDNTIAYLQRRAG